MENAVAGGTPGNKEQREHRDWKLVIFDFLHFSCLLLRVLVTA